MSRSGNPATPASGRTAGALSVAARWWPRLTGDGRDAGAAPGADDPDGRWGVARLVAQREAELRETGDGPDGPTSDVADPEPDDTPSPPAPRAPEPAAPPAPRRPLRPGPPVEPRPLLPLPRRPRGRFPDVPAPAVPRGVVVRNAADSRAARPPVEPDLALFGFSRHTRGRLGARLFTLFFLLVFAFIAAQTIASIV